MITSRNHLNRTSASWRFVEDGKTLTFKDWLRRQIGNILHVNYLSRKFGENSIREMIGSNELNKLIRGINDEVKQDLVYQSGIPQNIEEMDVIPRFPKSIGQNWPNTNPSGTMVDTGMRPDALYLVMRFIQWYEKKRSAPIEIIQSPRSGEKLGKSTRIFLERTYGRTFLNEKGTLNINEYYDEIIKPGFFDFLTDSREQLGLGLTYEESKYLWDLVKPYNTETHMFPTYRLYQNPFKERDGDVMPKFRGRLNAFDYGHKVGIFTRISSGKLPEDISKAGVRPSVLYGSYKYGLNTKNDFRLVEKKIVNEIVAQLSEVKNSYTIPSRAPKYHLTSFLIYNAIIPNEWGQYRRIFSETSGKLRFTDTGRSPNQVFVQVKDLSPNKTLGLRFTPKTAKNTFNDLFEDVKPVTIPDKTEKWLKKNKIVTKENEGMADDIVRLMNKILDVNELFLKGLGIKKGFWIVDEDTGGEYNRIVLTHDGWIIGINGLPIARIEFKGNIKGENILTDIYQLAIAQESQRLFIYAEFNESHNLYIKILKIDGQSKNNIAHLRMGYILKAFRNRTKDSITFNEAFKKIENDSRLDLGSLDLLTKAFDILMNLVPEEINGTSALNPWNLDKLWMNILDKVEKWAVFCQEL